MSKTYGAIEYNTIRVEWVITACEPHVALRLKQLFPKIRKTSLPPYRFLNTLDTCADLFWFIQRYALAITEADLDILTNRNKDYFNNIEAREKILLPNWRSPIRQGLKPGCELRHYQQQEVALLENVEKFLCVDDIGLGKTYTGIGCCLIPGALPAAVVVQTHLNIQWQEKIEGFSFLNTHAITKTTPYDIPEADIYIFKYTQLAGWVNVFAEKFFKMAIFDEIQEIRRGDESAKGRGAKCLVENVQYAIGLTATPIYNYGIEIFNIVDVLRPGLLGTRDEFTREWCEGDSKIVQDPKALGSYLRENHALLRHTKTDAYGEGGLAKFNPIVENIGYDEKPVRDVAELAKKLAITALTGSFVERGQAYRDLDIRMRHATGVSKAKYVADFVRMVIEAGEPVILGGWHRDVYEIWLKELSDLKPLMITGSETPAQKNRSKEAFINGDSKLLILSLRSGAGLDGFQHMCSTAIIGELDWSPFVHKQFFGRLDRDGQTSPVMGLYLIAEYGSDPAIVELLGLKNSQATGVLDPDVELVQVVPNKNRLKELARSFLNKKELARIEAEQAVIQVVA